MYLQSLSQAGHLCNSRANSSGGSVLPQSPSGPLNSKVRSSRFNQILQARVTDLARQSWSRSCLNLNRMKQLHRIHISAPEFWTNYSWTKWPQPLGAGRERKAGGVKTQASINTVLQAGMLSKQTLRQEKIIIKKLITWDELFPSAQAKPSFVTCELGAEIWTGPSRPCSRTCSWGGRARGGEPWAPSFSWRRTVRVHGEVKGGNHGSCQQHSLFYTVQPQAGSLCSLAGWHTLCR